MTIVQMLEQSGVMTLLGMSIVFGFLVIMVICVSAMGKVIHALGINKGAGASGVSSQASIQATSTVKSAAVTAAITAAVSEYRKDNN